MPSFWSRDANVDKAPRVPDRRGRSADSKRAAKQLCCRLAQHDPDSSVAELSAEEQMKKDSHYSGIVDTTTSVADDVIDSQSLDGNVDCATTENGWADVKVRQYKEENERLKDLLRRRTHDLRGKCSALSICQTELAEALISQTTDDPCVKGRQIHKLARDLKDRLCHSEMQMKILREERDQATFDLTALSGKMTTCTAIAEEQAKLLKGQLETIRKFENKIQILEKALKEMRTGHRQTVVEFESSIEEMQAEHKEKLQDYENSIQDLQAKHKEEIQLLAKSKHDMRAGYKEERAALEEQLRLHQQRAAHQDRKLKRYHHELDVASSELLKGRTREAEMEDQLHAQATVCKNTTKELSAAIKEIEQLKSVSLDLHEQEERMEQLWVDNARLVHILAESEEYQNLVLEMQGGKGLVFCPSLASRFESLAERYGAAYSSVPINPKAERDQWIPADLYDLVMTFRKEQCSDLETEVVKNMLRLVSTFWRQRYKKVVHQVKLKQGKQVADLKRRFSQQQPYDKVVQSSYSRQTTEGAQSKTLKKASPATRQEAYSHPDQSVPIKDIESSWSPLARRGTADEYYEYKAREVADAHSPRGQVQTKQYGSPAKGREKWSRTSPVKHIDSYHRSIMSTGGENHGDKHDGFYLKSGSAGKNHESNEILGGSVGEWGRSHGILKDGGSRQRGHLPSKNPGREFVSHNLQESKTGRLRESYDGRYLDIDDEGDPEKLSPPDRVASKQRKTYYMRKCVRSSPKCYQYRDRSKSRRRNAAAEADLDGFKSFSGSSSV